MQSVVEISKIVCRARSALVVSCRFQSCLHDYASVGGATRHTVVRRFVIRSLCLGGRSHEAYCNRDVCLSVCRSVCLLHHFCGARWKVSSETCTAGRNQYYLGCELAKVPCKALF